MQDRTANPAPLAGFFCHMLVGPLKENQLSCICLKSPYQLYIDMKCWKDILLYFTTQVMYNCTYRKKCPKVSRNVQKCQEMSRNVEMSKNVQKCPKMSRHVQKCSEISRKVRKCPEISRNVQKCPEMSGNVQKCPEMLRICLRNIWMPLPKPMSRRGALHEVKPILLHKLRGLFPSCQ